MSSKLIGFQLKKYYTTVELQKFANYMIDISNEIGFKVSSRGWAYILEGHRLINKDQFDKIEELINNCRRKGFLPIDFVAEEKAREFDGVESKTDGTVVGRFGDYLKAALNADRYYTPDWWEGEEYYIQVIGEKVDLVTLFSPVCEEYHIPLANTKGWSSMLQRAEYARRFAEARDRGLQCVLLYCGDHDPDGLRISDFILKNLDDLKNITWEDGVQGYDPSDLIIERFGLNYEFIMQYRLTWIDNLITGSGKDLASPRHKNFKLPYLQSYLKTIGKRKVEANSIVTQPLAARQLIRETIEKYLGPDAPDRFRAKREAVTKQFRDWMTANKLDNTLDNTLKLIDKYESDNSDD
jgi:hypothetical protein